MQGGMVRSSVLAVAAWALSVASVVRAQAPSAPPTPPSPAAASSPAAPAASLAPAEVRGTWVTTTANKAISTPEKTAQTMQRLRDIGLNVVYVECWKNGYTEFPSQTMEKLIGVPMKVNDAPADLQRDLLLETTIEAHRNGLLAIAWFEYGFMAANKDTRNELRALGEKEGWLLQDKEKNYVSKQDSFVWMNPIHPKPQQIVTDIVLEAVKKYDLDGVQLDDRIAMPVRMGYDQYTRELYAKEHNGVWSVPEDPSDFEFMKWRSGKITEYARKFASAVRKANPNILVSVSPAPYPWCFENFLCDWPTWMTWTGDERWDEVVPQNYRFSYERTLASVYEQTAVVGPRMKDLIAGIRIVGDGPDLPAEEVTETIKYTRFKKMGGHVLWFSRGVLDVHPEPLRDFYNVAQLGRAPHPARPADWRPLPTVATKVSESQWNVTVATAGKYRMIAKKNGRWELVRSSAFSAGPQTLEISGASAVELLVDRRG